MQVGMQVRALKELAEKRRDDFEKKRLTNDAIAQGWVMNGCDTILSRVPNDTLIPQTLWSWVTQKVESLADITWQAGRDEVIDEIASALAPAHAKTVQ